MDIPKTCILNPLSYFLCHGGVTSSCVAVLIGALGFSGVSNFSRFLMVINSGGNKDAMLMTNNDEVPVVQHVAQSSTGGVHSFVSTKPYVMNQ